MAAAPASAPAAPRVVLYSSEVAGKVGVKKSQEAIRRLFNAMKIPFTEIDVSLESNKAERDKMRETSGSSELPQVFVDGAFKGGYEQIQEQNEMGSLRQYLGFQ
jgi:glutaredoxin